MKLLNGCAKSKFIADAFESLGWEAWTCDILPAEGRGNHIQDDVLRHLNDGWDMAIFHPDCTYLANSGVRWLVHGTKTETASERWVKTQEASLFFNQLLVAHIPRIAIENPIQHRYTLPKIRKYDQIIQPWQFGDMESKAICLWLKGLPPLIKLITQKPVGVKQSVWKEPPSLDRKANRARNFRGVSRAMAEQWGNEVESEL